MFKIQNNQPTKANQQLLDEIELMSGQEMVELDSQELMNVVGGENSKSTEESIGKVNLEPINVDLNDPPPGKATVSGGLPPKATVEPYPSN